MTANAKRTSRLVSRVLTAAVLLAALASPTAAQNRQPVEVVYLSAGTSATEADWNKKWVGRFNAENPDIRVRLETVSWPELFSKVASYTAAGNPPDMAWYAPSQMYEFQKMGILEPLDQWLGKSKGEYLASILNPTTSDVMFDGKMYGAPFTLAGNNLAARNDALIEAGIASSSLATFTGFAAAAKAVHNPPRRYATYFTFADATRTAAQANMYITGFGLENIADVRPEKQRDYVRALDYINKLFPYMPPSMVSWQYVDALQAYSNGLVALHPTGSYLLGEIGRTAPDVMTANGTVNLPWPSAAGRPRVRLYTVGYVMFKNSKHKPETARVIQYLTDKTGLYEWPMNMNPKIGMTNAERMKVNEFGSKMSWYLGSWDDMLKRAQVIRTKLYTPADEINAIFRDTLLEMYNKRLTPAQAYDQLRAKITPIKGN